MKQVPAVITGVGETTIGKHYGKTTLDLTFEAAEKALADADCDWDDIDGLIVTQPLVGAFPRHALAVAENLGISSQLRYAEAIPMGGSSSLLGLINADRAIKMEDCSSVLIVAADTPRTGQSRQESVKHFAEQRHPDWEQPIGMLNASAYALLASEYLSRHKLGSEDLLHLPLMLRRHAMRTSTAAYRDKLSISDAAESRVIASPLRLVECSPINDGAGALVVTSNREVPTKAVRLAGHGFATDYDSYVFKQGELAAPSRAFLEASKREGLSVADCDFAMIYDSYSIALALQLEAIGISCPGQAAKDAQAGRFDIDGDLPINPHGGLLSHGHCGGASGMHHLVELVKQLRGEAENQVPIAGGAALYQAEGGILSANTSAFLQLV